MSPRIPHFSIFLLNLFQDPLHFIYSMVPWLTQAFPFKSKLTATILPKVLAERESCLLKKPWTTFPCILLVLIALQTCCRTNYLGQKDRYADCLKLIGPILLVGSIVLKTDDWDSGGVFLQEQSLAIIDEWKGRQQTSEHSLVVLSIWTLITSVMMLSICLVS